MRFAARRFAQAVPLLLIVSLLVFALIHAAPGGPLSLYLDNPNVRPEDIERLRRAMGLDRPLGAQYLSWLWRVRARRLGLQLRRRPSGARAHARARPGDAAARRRVDDRWRCSSPSSSASRAALRRGVDRAASVVAVAGLSLPVFWFGLVLQLAVQQHVRLAAVVGTASFGGGGLRGSARAPRPAGHGARRRARRGLVALPARLGCGSRSRSRSRTPRAPVA